MPTNERGGSRFGGGTDCGVSIMTTLNRAAEVWRFFENNNHVVIWRGLKTGGWSRRTYTGIRPASRRRLQRVVDDKQVFLYQDGHFAYKATTPPAQSERLAS
jgi:hypothetical protein